MIYLLFYKSSFTDQNKIFHTLLFGTLLYMVIHMVLTFIDSNTLNIIKNNYFTLFALLDLISFIYIAYGDGNFNLDGNKPIKKEDKEEEDINRTIDKLKNKINNITGASRNDEPVISFTSGNGDINPHPKLHVELPQNPPKPIIPPPKKASSTPISEISMGHHPSQIQGQVQIVGQHKNKLDESKFPPINDPIQQELDNLAKSMNQSEGSQSTLISNLGSGGNGNSTSITDLKGDSNNQPSLSDQFIGSQSDTLSDIGSNLDLDLSEFENSLLV